MLQVWRELSFDARPREFQVQPWISDDFPIRRYWFCLGDPRVDWLHCCFRAMAIVQGGGRDDVFRFTYACSRMFCRDRLCLTRWLHLKNSAMLIAHQFT